MERARALATSPAAKTAVPSADRALALGLASIVELAGNSEPRAVCVLATLVAVQYRDFVPRFSERELATLVSLAPGSLSPADRAIPSRILTVRRAPEPDTFDFGWQDNAALADEAVQFGARVVRIADGVVYRMHGSAAQPLLAKWRGQGIPIVASSDVVPALERRVDRRVSDISPPDGALPAWMEGETLVLKPQTAAHIAIARAVPNRVYDRDTQTWRVPALYALDVRDNLRAAGANVRALDALGLERFAGQLPAIRVEDRGARFAVGFPYDEALQAAVRAIPGAEYLAAETAWLVPPMEMHQFDAILRAHPNKYDRTALDAALSSIPAPAPDVAIAIPPIPGAKEYQLEGIRWLTQPLAPLRQRFGASLRGFVLADDRGLGKTMEGAIAAHLVTPADQPIVVISPMSYVYGWEEEIKRWVGRDQRVAIVRTGKETLPDARWIIVGYDLLEPHYAALRERGIGALIVDEAHRIKNIVAKRSRLIAGFESTRDPAKNIAGLTSAVRGRVFLLTGTPIPNRMRDAFNLWRAIGHPYGHSFYRFAERFCGPERHPPYGTLYDGASNVEEMRAGVEPIFLQRRKDQVALELPPKIREYLSVDVDRRPFQALLAQYREDMSQPDFWRQPGRTLKFFQDARKATAFAKIPATIDYARDAVADGAKVVIFSSSTQVLDAMAERFGEEAVMLDGRKSASARSRAITAFNTDPSKRVFLGQWEAAGESITLTGGSQVLFNELDWVPKTHKQCEDRVHRIGQGEMVRVTYMVARGTLDIDIAPRLRKKMDKINAFEGTDDSFFRDLATAAQRRFDKTLTLTTSTEPRLASSL